MALLSGEAEGPEGSASGIRVYSLCGVGIRSGLFAGAAGFGFVMQVIAITGFMGYCDVVELGSFFQDRSQKCGVRRGGGRGFDPSGFS